MIDPCQELLLNQYRNTEKCTESDPSTLWVLDENSDYLTQNLRNDKNSLYVTNRWDIHTQLNQHGNFSDYDLTAYDELDTVFFRLCKEKAVVHHIINQSFNALKLGGQLILTGEKNEGVKTYEKKAKALFGSSDIKKSKNTYLVVLTKTQSDHAENLLDDQHYCTLREIDGLANYQCYSKPGIFGWNKIDQGSKLLLEQFESHTQIITEEEKQSFSVLDLGCGWGYLSLSLHRLGYAHIDATDNNAAAVNALTATTKENNLAFSVWADHCAESTDKQYDLILCNPPFHKGFDHSYPLTDTFLKALKRLIKHNGKVFLVANQFIPVEKFGQSYFKIIQTLATVNGFKVLSLAN